MYDYTQIKIFTCPCKNLCTYIYILCIYFETIELWKTKKTNDSQFNNLLSSYSLPRVWKSRIHLRKLSFFYFVVPIDYAYKWTFLTAH